LQIRFSANAVKQLKKIDKHIASRIIDFLENKVAELNDPRQIGKILQGNLASLWRYRVGDYRIVVEIQDRELVIHVVKIGHRKSVY